MAKVLKLMRKIVTDFSLPLQTWRTTTFEETVFKFDKRKSNLQVIILKHFSRRYDVKKLQKQNFKSKKQKLLLSRACEIT